MERLGYEVCRFDRGSERRAKVVANIPYNITTDILKRLLPMGDTFEDLVFMFQEEVARRLATEERDEKMIENEQIKKKKKSNSDFRACQFARRITLNHDTFGQSRKVVLILHQTWKVV